jgi:hypothetical protein
MKRTMLSLMLLLACRLPIFGQILDGGQANHPTTKSSVPLLVRFSGTLLELTGATSSGQQNVTFSLYGQQTGGAPLWAETQTVLPDKDGNVAVLLGAASSLGIPASIFASGLPRWVGMTPNDGMERSRVVLSSVPYALKAADADTLGGLGAEQFVSVQQLSSMLGGIKPNLPIAIKWLPRITPQGSQPQYEATSPNGPSFISDATIGPPFQVASPSIVSGLNVDFLHGFTDAEFAKISQNNLFSQMQSFAGGIDLPATTAESNAPNMVDSAPLNFDSTSVDPQTGVKSTERLTWISEPTVGPNGSPSAKLSLFISINGAQPTSTGLSINSDGSINFPPGQQATGLGNGAAGPGPGSPNSPFANTNAYKWSEQPQQGIQVGPNSVTLIPCPRGVNSTDLWHYLYVGGAGTPEVVLITGGTCLSRASGGDGRIQCRLRASPELHDRIGYRWNSRSHR